MKKLIDYIKESTNETEYYITEGLWDTIKGWLSNFSSWLFSDNNTNKSSDEKFLSIDPDYNNDLVADPKKYLDSKFNANNIVVDFDLKSIDNVKKLIAKSGTDSDNKQGFWYINNLIKDNNYSNYNNYPLYVKYCGIYYVDAHVNDLVGIICWSDSYHKHNNDPVYDKYIHLFGLQTLDKYKGRGLLKKYIKEFIKYGKAHKFNGLTLKYNNDTIKTIFYKAGLNNDDKEHNLLYVKF